MILSYFTSQKSRVVAERFCLPVLEIVMWRTCMQRVAWVSCLMSLLIWSTGMAFAQDQAGLEQGLKPYGSFEGGDFDSISMVNRGINLHIPLVSYPQRGNLHLGFYIMYQNPVYEAQQVNCLQVKPYTCTFQYIFYRAPQIQIVPDFLLIASCSLCGTGGYYQVADPDGQTHQLGQISSGNWVSLDTTGYNYNPTSAVLTDRHGIQYATTTTQNRQIYLSKVEDTNGNMITSTADPYGGDQVWTDTLGRSIDNPPPPTGPDQWTPNVTSNFSGCTGTLTTTTAVNWTIPGYNGNMIYKVCYAQVNVIATFTTCGANCTGINQSDTVIQSIVLPNGTAWTFTYNNNSYANLTQISFPTGGSISYSSTPVSFCDPVDNSHGVPSYHMALTSRGINSNDGTGTHTTSYSETGVQNNTVVTTSTDPLGNQAVHTLSSLGTYGCSYYETQTQFYQGTSTLLKTVSTTYSSSYDPYAATVMDVVPTTIVTAYPNGQQMKTMKTYDSGIALTGTGAGYSAIYGDMLTQQDDDFGNGAPGNLLRTTTNVYEFQQNSSYLNNNLLDLPATVKVQDGSGNQVSYTQYNYDESARASSGLTSSYQFDSAPITGNFRGNNTSVDRWLNSGTFTCPNGHSGGSGGYLISNKTFFDDGMLNTSADPCGNTATYAYSLTYWGALPTTVTNALSQSTTHGYDFNTGLVTSTTDPNNLTTSFTYDSMWRIYQANNPDGSQDVVTHQESTFPFTATITSQINSSQSKVETNVFDGFSRVTQHQLSSDPQGTIYTDTAYDALGRVATESNPYRTGTDATTSTGTTTYGYDALSRKIKVTYPDNSVLNTAYCGPSTLVTDPTGKWRRSRLNGLGQLVEVDEPNSPTATVNSNGCPGTGEPIWVTSYTNDALGNLTQVVQNGSHTRTFTYDSLSRLLCSSNPENSSTACPAFGGTLPSSGAVVYAYNPDGTLLNKKDARSITANYTYDALLRTTGVTYSNGDPAITYTYDQTNCLGLSACQNIGHRTSMTDGAGSEQWAYQTDSTNLRSVHQEKRTNGTLAAKTTTYYFDLAGNVTQLQYPTGRIVNYTYDAADRPSTAADSSNGITYATGWGTPPANTACTTTAVCYTPQGSEYAANLAKTSVFSGINVLESYNNRLQPNEIKATAPQTFGTAMDITYNFVDPSSTHNAGVVYGITNNLNSARTQTFTYDQLNRIVSAGTSATAGTYCWGYTFSYDPYGNLLTQAGGSSYGSCTESTMSVTADGSNHIFSPSNYDAAGNTLNDGNYTYTYDGESQLKTAGGVTYSYDGDGRRAAKVGSKLYWYGSGGEILAETDASGNVQNEYVYFGGKRIALVPHSGDKLFYIEDLLGSSRLIAKASAICYDADFTPFGSEKAYTNTCSQNYKFEGKERDTETQNDDFGAREYTWRFGRWLTSDWSSVPVAVPYANLSNPQTLNLYAMVDDDPESFADLDGHAPQQIATQPLLKPCTGVAEGQDCAPDLIAQADPDDVAFVPRNVKNDDDEIDANAETERALVPEAQPSAPTEPPYLRVIDKYPPKEVEAVRDGACSIHPELEKAVKEEEALNEVLNPLGRKTPHAEQRASEARDSDPNRQVGDANRTIREGRRFRDTETGNTVHVRGNRVVIRDSEGKQVTQFKNSRANTQKRIRSGRWEPID